MIDHQELEAQALAFATKMHAGQIRKYTDEAYILHPIAVACTLREHGYSGHIVAAAFLHDVVEDCDCTEAELRQHFPKETCDLVMEVTDVSDWRIGTRAERKQQDLEHLKQASPEAQTIKMADLGQNIPSIVKHDPAFAKVYLPEIRAILAELTEGDAALTTRANRMLETAEHALASSLQSGNRHQNRYLSSKSGNGRQLG